MRPFFVVAVAAFVAAAALLVTGADAPFARFFGGPPPLLVFALATVAGAVAFRLLIARGWCPPGMGWELTRGVRRSMIAAVVFAAIAISFDLWIAFPEDLNARWPGALLFYPAIAFVAEVAFHVIPLAVVVTTLGWHFDTSTMDRRAWTAIALVVSLEAAFQVAIAASDADPRQTVFVVAHLVAIGSFELLTLRRFGLIPMLAFRLSYYALWHIAWGHVRLDLLF